MKDMLHQHGDEQNQDNPEEQLVRNQFRESIQSCIHRLSEREKAVFLLKHNANLKFREISTVMNLSQGTVKSLHHRAVTKIKRQVTSAGRL